MYAIINSFYVYGRSYIFIKHQEAYSYTWNKFLDPFELRLWIAVLFSIIILSIALWLTHNLGCSVKLESSGRLRLFNSLLEASLCVFSSFCFQGNQSTSNRFTTTSKKWGKYVLCGYNK